MDGRLKNKGVDKSKNKKQLPGELLKEHSRSLRQLAERAVKLSVPLSAELKAVNYVLQKPSVSGARPLL